MSTHWSRLSAPTKVLPWAVRYAGRARLMPDTCIMATTRSPRLRGSSGETRLQVHDLLTYQADAAQSVVTSKQETNVIDYRSSHPVLFRYDRPDISELILSGSIRVSTLDACRHAENLDAADLEEGTKTITSLPGVDYPDTLSFAKLLGVDPSDIELRGPAPVVLTDSNAVVRKENVEAFVYCTSSPLGDADSLRANFGHGCVRIANPHAFFEAIDAALRNAIPLKLSICVVDDVEYTPLLHNLSGFTPHPGLRGNG